MLNTLFTLFKRELEEIGIKTQYYDGLLVAQGKILQKVYLVRILIDMVLFVQVQMSSNLQPFLQKNRSDLRGNSLSEQTYQLIAKDI